MKIKTTELIGPALDWAVMQCKHPRNSVSFFLEQRARHPIHRLFYYSTDWSVGGPIIEREGITIVRCDDDFGVDEKGYCNNVRIPVWAATTGQHSFFTGYDEPEPSLCQYESDVVFGPTPLVAAMRCYVLSNLDDKIEIPEEIT